MNEDQLAKKAAAVVKKAEQSKRAPGRPPGESALDKLVALAEQNFKLIRDEHGRAFAIERSGPYVAVPVGGKAIEHRLLLMYADRNGGKVPNREALRSVARLLEARASVAESTALVLRTGASAGEIWIDMGDAKGRAIRVVPGKWEILDCDTVRAHAPGPFRRTGVTKPLWEPVGPGLGDDAPMRRLFHFGDAEWDFLIGWWVLAFVPGISHVILHLEGQPGTAKTTTTQQFLDIIDPSTGALCGQPEDPKELFDKALPSWAFALENVSYVTRQVSDGLCRLVTGYEDRRRELYTNDDTHAYGQVMRVLVMNGVGITGIRSDLQDRSINIQLPVIPENRRMTEERVDEAFANAAPNMLGFLLDVLADVLTYARANNLGKTRGKYQPAKLPRMASFGQWLHYVDLVLETGALEWYMTRWREDRQQLATEDPLAMSLWEFLADTGTRSETMFAARWLDQLEPPLKAAGRKDFPSSPRGLTARLRMLQKGLTEVGWTVEETRGDGGAAKWKIGLPVIAEKAKTGGPKAKGKS